MSHDEPPPIEWSLWSLQRIADALERIADFLEAERSEAEGPMT